MPAKKWKDLEKKAMSPERIERIHREAEIEVALLRLRELRELAGKTQNEVADVTEKSQAEISRLERRGDALLSTLRKYVHALGGELEVVAHIGHKHVTLIKS